MKLIEQLQQLAELAAQATAGPWKDHAILLEPAAIEKLTANNDQAAVGLAADMPSGPRNAVALCGPLHDKESRMTAAFIAAARNVFTPENLALLTAALAPASDEAELLRLCGRGIAAARTQVAITELIDTLKWLVPLVPKSKLDGDALEAIGGARFTGEELVTELRSKVSAIEKQVAELSAALVTVGRSPAND